MLAGDLPAAELELRRGVELLEGMGERAYLSTLGAMLADVLELVDKDDEAGRFARVSEEASDPDDIDSQARWRAVKAKLLAKRGRLEVACGTRPRSGAPGCAHRCSQPARPLRPGARRRSCPRQDAAGTALTGPTRRAECRPLGLFMCTKGPAGAAVSAAALLPARVRVHAVTERSCSPDGCWQSCARPSSGLWR
jgi:hypothetical protein